MNCVRSDPPPKSPFPSAPEYRSPPGATDCHCHVFGPYDRFPLAEERTYNPPEVPVALYLKMLDTLGLDRGVLVQASAYGLNNDAMLEALAQAPDRLRGIAVVSENTPIGVLRDLRDRGVRGLRLSRLLWPDGSQRYRNTVDISALDSLLPAMRSLGMHAQLWITLDQLRHLAPVIRKASIPFVIDHLGRSLPQNGIADPDFRLMCELMSEGHLWVKLTPYRASQAFPDYDDMQPLHEQLLRVNPERLLWGSDWPHINMQKDVPNAGHLLDLLQRWTADAILLKRILVDNPASLYEF